MFGCVIKLPEIYFTAANQLLYQKELLRKQVKLPSSIFVIIMQRERMRKTISISITILILLCGSGCKKTELSGDLEMYEGRWESFDSELELMSNGRANYYNFQNNRSINGRLIISGNKLKINAVFAGKNFNIDQPPTEQENESGESELVMLLDGLEFIRQ